jgi:aminomethyltransferase
MNITLPQTGAVVAASATGGASQVTRSEFAALHSSCGLFDLRGRAKVILTGQDRLRWLNGMVTNNVRDLSPGHGVYAFLLNPQGHILGDLYVYHRGDGLLIDTDGSQLEKIRATFDHYIIMDDVEVADAGEKLAAIGVAGPTSREVLRGAGIEVPDLTPLQFTDIGWQQVALTLVRGDSASRDWFEVWIAPEHFDKLQAALITAGAVSVGAETLELSRIADGVPRYGQDIRERDLPQETNQARALHFSKGCYVGQEIVERIRSRGGVHRTFTGFSVEGPLPMPGSKIQSEGKDVGEITSSAHLPVAGGDRAVALGYIRKEAVNRNLSAGDARLTVCAPSSGGLLES